MKFTTPWGILSLAFWCYILETTGFVVGNSGSSHLPVPRKRSECSRGSIKKCSIIRTGRRRAMSFVPTKRTSGTGNFSQKIIRSTDQNETYDGFEFVDSPEIPSVGPDSTDKPDTGAHGMVVGYGSIGDTGGGSSNGGIEKNSWKTYPNGTIIHDVRISLIHPANMVGFMNGGDPSGVSKGSDDSSRLESKSTSNRSTGGTTNAAAADADATTAAGRLNRSADYEANSGPMVAQLSSCSFPTTVGNITDDLMNNSTAILPSAPTFNTSDDNDLVLNENTTLRTTTNVFTAHRVAPDGGFSPVANEEVSITVNHSCFTKCLTRCSMTELANAKAICLPCLDTSTKGGLEVGNTSDDEALMKDSVPILPLHQKDVLANITNANLELASGVVMLKTKESNLPKLGFSLEDICLSESCVLKAADIIRRLNKSVNPCDSFYNFACGGYFKNEIPEGWLSRSVFSDISADILARINSILNSTVQAEDDPALKLLKKFYGKCTGTSTRELLVDALRQLGGWPTISSSKRVLQHIWGEIAFNWTYGMFLEYNLVSINLTFASEGDTWTLNVGYPSFVKKAVNSDSDSVLDEMERVIRLIASAVDMMDNSTIRSVLSDLRIFMASAIKYATATVLTAEKGVFSLKELKTKFIHMDVFKKLPSLLKTAAVIGDDEMIHVSNMMYLRKVDDLLRDSTVRTQASHLVLTALHSLFWLIANDFETIREKYCVKFTGKLFPHLLNHVYASKFVSNSQVSSAIQIASHIKDSFLNLLDENVDDITQNKVRCRINELMFTWSHRFVMNDDLKGIALGYDENPSFLGYVKTGIRNLKKATYTYLHQRVNSSLMSFLHRYWDDSYEVNAFYYRRHVLIPSSAFHENIFEPDGPSYVSYGGLGMLVGHELLHSVIEAGHISNSVNYVNMEKCVEKQFDTYATKFPEKDRWNGNITKEENMADYGAFKVAYQAFTEGHGQYSKETTENRLPGLHKFNEKQMFWLSAASNWCQKVSPHYMSKQVDEHAPNEFRVDGQFANIPEFSRDFSCPEGSPMNPKEKCSLW